ncbi:hypothetical protein WEI85_48305 [Actinomycetes bacterium KLBMP 9797]
MSKRLRYADAVRLLGGESKSVAVLDGLATGVIAAAAVPVPAVLGLLDAKNELVKLGHKLIGGLAERRSGLSRHGRTERLAAAHEVIAVTAYFEALGEAELPVPFGELELTRDEQSKLGGGPLVRRAFEERWPGPWPEEAREVYLATLHRQYRALSQDVLRFVEGLAVWERLGDTKRRAFAAALEGVPDRAVTRYEELIRQLAVDFPEVAFWLREREHRATRAELRRLGAALDEVGGVLAAISTGRVPDDRRAALARAYQAELSRPVAASGDVPAGLRMPALDEAYLTPRYRAAWIDPRSRPSDEAWWSDMPVRDDFERFLIGYLTSPRAVEAPLLVLGQPGSGKSLLTKVLAARLPAADFLPVRVVLRDVSAVAGVQDQIEHAIRAATGERLEWPALVRSAGDALPVVLLDGFDELVQATGVSQSDYLVKVAEFQRREADQGRPVVVLVTSRTSVADRATTPDRTAAVRLEPFDEERVAAWLAVWNSLNAGHLAAHGLTPLTAETALHHRELAEQPLLLLMLALYDADGNALQRLGAELRRDELYERLLGSFAAREVTKHRPGVPERELGRLVEQELRRLALVGFAMFNRGTQWITEADLAHDLRAVLGAPPPAAPDQLRAPLGGAEIVLGRFFFVHRARALRDEHTLETYEFLHATFGEFLVARLTWQVLRDIAAREAASTLSLGAGQVDDDLLHALLSCAALTARAPIVEFLGGLMARLSTEERADLADLLLRLFRAAHQQRPARRFEEYGPRLHVPLKHAVYSANLLVLAVCAAGTVRGSELFGGRPGDVIDHWHGEALLWRSQLDPEGWTSLVETLALERFFDGERRDIALSIDDGSFVVPQVDPYWTYGMAPDHPDRGQMAFTYSGQDPARQQRKAHFLCGINDDVTHHALEPLAAVLGPAVHTIVGGSPAAAWSAVHALLDVWTLPMRQVGEGEREAAYDRCARIAATDFPPWRAEVRRAYATLLLQRLATDYQVSADLARRITAQVAPHTRP